MNSPSKPTENKPVPNKMIRALSKKYLTLVTSEILIPTKFLHTKREMPTPMPVRKERIPCILFPAITEHQN